MPIIYVAIGVAVSTVADVFLKKSGLQNYRYIIYGIALYALGAIPVAYAFKSTDFSLVFFIWEAIAIIMGLGLGIIIFKESFSLFKVAAFLFAALSLLFSYLATK